MTLSNARRLVRALVAHTWCHHIDLAGLGGQHRGAQRLFRKEQLWAPPLRSGTKRSATSGMDISGGKAMSARYSLHSPEAWRMMARRHVHSIEEDKEVPDGRHLAAVHLVDGYSWHQACALNLHRQHHKHFRVVLQPVPGLWAPHATPTKSTCLVTKTRLVRFFPRNPRKALRSVGQVARH